MTNEYELADDSREDLIFTKDQLLAPLQPGMETPPHPMRLGNTETDYYRLAAEATAPAGLADEVDVEADEGAVAGAADDGGTTPPSGTGGKEQP